MAENKAKNDFCQVCGSEAARGYATPLCQACRCQLSRRPFPLWIKGFFLIVLLCLSFSLFRLFPAVRGGIAYERGKAAEAGKCFLTAMREFRKAADCYPDSRLVLVRWYNACFMVGKYKEADQVLALLDVSTLGDASLAREANQLTKRLKALTSPSGPFEQFMKKCEQGGRPIPIQELRQFVEENPGDLFATILLAEKLYAENDLMGSNQYLTPLLKAYPDFQRGYLLQTSILRDMGDYEGALALCRSLLAKNKESTGAYAAMIQIELKRHQDAEALRSARQLLALDPDDPGAQDVSVMALHYNGLVPERDDMYHRFMSNPATGDQERRRLEGIIRGSLKWRD